MSRCNCVTSKRAHRIRKIACCRPASRSGSLLLRIRAISFGHNLVPLFKFVAAPKQDMSARGLKNTSTAAVAKLRRHTQVADEVNIHQLVFQRAFRNPRGRQRPFLIFCESHRTHWTHRPFHWNFRFLHLWLIILDQNFTRNSAGSEYHIFLSFHTCLLRLFATRTCARISSKKHHPSLRRKHGCSSWNCR